VAWTVAETPYVVVAVAARAGVGARPRARRLRATAGRTDFIEYENFMGNSEDGKGEVYVVETATDIAVSRRVSTLVSR
jgi:hypothetical protein